MNVRPGRKDRIAAIDAQLQIAVANLRRGQRRGQDDQALRSHVDELLELRIAAHDAAVIDECERKLSHR